MRCEEAGVRKDGHLGNRNMVCWIAKFSVSNRFLVERKAINSSTNIELRPVMPNVTRPRTWDRTHFLRGERWMGGSIHIRERLIRPYKRLPHLLAANGPWFVSETLRQLIEEREPDVHQFFKIDLDAKDGSPWPVPYYLFNVCQHLPAALLDRSQLVWRTNPYGQRYASAPAYDDRLVVDHSVIAGKHVWKDKHFVLKTFFSDDLKRACMSTKIDALEYIRVQELPPKET